MGSQYLRIGNGADSTLGEGAYGTVFRAWDTVSQRLVAIKRQNRCSETAEREMMFFHTIPRHPNLLKMFDQYVVKEHLFLVFEYCTLSLSDVFQRAGGFLDWIVAEDHMRGVLQGLAHIHAHHVAHRDLSMSNVLLDAHGSVRVADLGLAACATKCVLERPVTSAWYRAPEACLGIEQLHTSQCTLDAWSSGVLMAALFTGTHLFRTGPGRGAPQVRARAIEVAVLQGMVDLLGSPLADYPDIARLPRWNAYSELLSLSLTSAPAPLAEMLQRPDVVARPLLEKPALLDMISRLLVWLPEARSTISATLEHKFWEGRQTETVEVGACSPPTGSPELPSPTPARGLAAELAEASLAKQGAPSVVGAGRPPTGSPKVPSPTPARGLAAKLAAASLAKQDAPSVVGAGRPPTGSPKVLSPTPARSHGAAASPAGSPSVSAGEPRERNLCGCRGHCGNLGCMASKRKHYRHRESDEPNANHSAFCSNAPAGEGGLCNQCRCEVAECQEPRTTRGEWRWCAAHAIVYADLVESKRYSNANGAYCEGKSWTWELRMVARHVFCFVFVFCFF